ncbi:MAG: C-factor, partial [Phenylobacterium sp.]|nr:C-factor [Phenylobacterium sp.]
MIGASGGIGAALIDALKTSGRYDQVVGLGRGSSPSLDLLDPASV